jgi:diguanylate cyclase (GGDEF)-like protein
MNEFDVLKSYPVSIVVADIDNFKAINDNFEHHFGDEILMIFADILKKNAQSGEVVARIGGDEFAIIMPEASEMAVREFCNAISRDCENFELFSESPKLRRAVETQDTTLSVSLGYAAQRGQFASIEDALREADRRMYEDKIRKKRFGRMEEVVHVLQIVMRERIPHVFEHSKRLQELITPIGAKLKLSESAMADLSISALFHDIGKLGIPDALLCKEAVLTEQEMKRMKPHTIFGYELLRNIPVLSHIAEYVLYHHERWDGNGYPEGLKGDEIPYFSRIISLVDAYAAMTSNRPYRMAMSEDEANEKIKMGANTQFDPELVDLFFKNG